MRCDPEASNTINVRKVLRADILSMMGGCVPDMHVWPPIRMDWRKMTKTRDSILRMNQTIVYVGFNAGKNIILILRAESPILKTSLTGG